MKKLFKKSLSIIMVVIMTLTAAPLGGFVGLELPDIFGIEAQASSHSGTCGENLTWTLDTETGVLEISGTGDMYDYSYNYPAPWGANGYIKTVNIVKGVTRIGRYAFDSCSNLMSVTIPDSVTTIGQRAFGYCDTLSSIIIPDSVTVVGAELFECCDKLTSVTLPNSITTIGYRMFWACSSLTSIRIPDSVTTIGAEAFSCCFRLMNVELPSSVISIGEDAFCLSNLIDITIPDSVVSIGESAFNCYSLTNITVDENNKNYSNDEYGVLFNKDKTELVQYPEGNTRTNYIIPDSVTTIGNHAFESCNLTCITLPDGLTTIGDGAFAICDFKNITLPDSVTTIGNRAFYSVPIKSIKIPDGVTTIAGSAFENCKSLKSVIIPNSVKTIGKEAFYDSNNIKDVYYGGTQEQWCEISIYSGNYNLTKDVKIHYNSTGPIYSKSHTVSNYQTQHASYTSKYFARAAQPMDGSDGTADLCIPGLSLGENMVPQGIAYYKAKNQLLVSSYYKDAKTSSTPCYIFVLDMATGEKVAEYKIKDSDGSDLSAHVGGIAVSNYNLYITGNDADICRVSLSQLEENADEITVEDKCSVSAWLGDANTAYLSIDGGTLVTGNFYYTKESKYNTPAKAAKSVILTNKLSGSSADEEWTNLCSFNSLSVVKVPDSVDRIQGAVYRNGKICISSSYGRKNVSTLYVADLSGNTLENISEYSAPPMMESITFCYDTILAVFESGSAFYLEGLDGNGGSKDPTDVVWKIDYRELIDVYNLGDETYCFKNFSDSHSNGHCFGMSMTSAGYHTRILDISTIGGNRSSGLYWLSGNSRVKEPICYYQDIQAKYSKKAIVAGGSSYTSWFGFSNIDSDWKEVINYVKNHEHDNKGTLQIGYRKNGEGGHAINFLRYEVVDGQERIYAYDNNYPNKEVYFYKASNGDILQAPYATFSGAIDCIALRSVEKYFNSIGDYNATRYIYANKDDITIPGSEVYLVDCGTVSKERIVFEIPEGEEKVTIVPLVENAEFEYLGVTYSFEQAEKGQTGEFTLAVDEASADETVELTFVGLPPDININQPSVTTVNYGDTLVLQLEEVEIPEGLAVAWFVEGVGISTWVSEDGCECRVTSIANGNPTVFAKLVDENENVVTDADGEEIFDEITIVSKAGFWQKFISFFKNLFGINRVIY